MTTIIEEDSDNISWYDGWFYANIIDRLSGKPFSKVIKSMINPNDSVIDIGCGTGSLVLNIADHCDRVIGLDISPKMIRYANKAKKKSPHSRVEFRLIDRNADLSAIFDQPFDCAIAKMVLHETRPEIRNRLIENIKKISGYAILTDWIYPQPGGIPGIMTKMIEYTAGKEHYRNFLNWCSLGGLDGFLETHRFKIVAEKLFKNSTGKIAKVTWD